MLGVVTNQDHLLWLVFANDFSQVDDLVSVSILSCAADISTRWEIAVFQKSDVGALHEPFWRTRKIVNTQIVICVRDEVKQLAHTRETTDFIKSINCRRSRAWDVR
ncbi:hypothetical protein D3C72_1894430 [compost metagenome]